MSERRCGYCRDYGHTANKCVAKESLRQAIAHHVLNERRRQSEILTAAGFGVGAIICDGNDESKLFLIENHNHTTRRNDLFDYRQVKYSKEVRITLQSFTGELHGPKENLLNVNINNRNYTLISATYMGNMTEAECFEITRDQVGLTNSVYGYSWYSKCKLVSPSYDAPEDKDYDTMIIFPRRLMRSSRDDSYIHPSSILKA